MVIYRYRLGVKKNINLQVLFHMSLAFDALRRILISVHFIGLRFPISAQPKLAASEKVLEVNDGLESAAAGHYIAPTTFALSL